MEGLGIIVCGLILSSAFIAAMYLGWIIADYKNYKNDE